MSDRLPASLLCLFGALHAAIPDRLALLRDAFRTLLHAHGRGDAPTALESTARRITASVGARLETGAGERVLSWLEAPGHQLLIQSVTGYPPALEAVGSPPPLLFVTGLGHLLSVPQLAVVGSRRATVAGRQVAQSLARELAAAGLVITSGLASGIDAAAHQGALEVGGHTVAVFGSGIDVVYPAAHRRLAEEIEACGALVSEFPLGTRPTRQSFPRRNRIIAGLALGTLVVEASMGSGSLITAREALDQGREVFAVPGSVLNPLTAGPHWLIRNGAALVASAADVLEELPAYGVCKIEKNKEITGSYDLSSDAKRVLAACGFESTTFDTLAVRSGLTPPELSSILTALDIQGWVRAEPGGTFVLLKTAPQSA